MNIDLSTLELTHYQPENEFSEIHAFLYKRDKAMVGRLFYSLEPDKKAFLANVQTLATYRGKGIATQLINLFVEECVKKSINTICLCASGDSFSRTKELVNWYQSFGFSVDANQLNKGSIEMTLKL